MFHVVTPLNPIGGRRFYGVDGGKEKTMPRLKGLTEEQRADAHVQKISFIFHFYLERTPVSVLGHLIGVEPVLLQRKFRGATKWDLRTFCRCCKELNVSDEDILKMVKGI